MKPTLQLNNQKVLENFCQLAQTSPICQAVGAQSLYAVSEAFRN